MNSAGPQSPIQSCLITKIERKASKSIQVPVGPKRRKAGTLGSLINQADFKKVIRKPPVSSNLTFNEEADLFDLELDQSLSQESCLSMKNNLRQLNKKKQPSIGLQQYNCTGRGGIIGLNR